MVKTQNPKSETLISTSPVFLSLPKLVGKFNKEYPIFLLIIRKWNIHPVTEINQIKSSKWWLKAPAKKPVKVYPVVAVIILSKKPYTKITGKNKKSD